MYTDGQKLAFSGGLAFLEEQPTAIPVSPLRRCESKTELQPGARRHPIVVSDSKSAILQEEMRKKKEGNRTHRHSSLKNAFAK